MNLCMYMQISIGDNTCVFQRQDTCMPHLYVYLLIKMAIIFNRRTKDNYPWELQEKCALIRIQAGAVRRGHT